MSALGSKLRLLEGGSVMFKCPGCKENHVIHIEGSNRPVWTFNGNGDKPTFQPSVLVTSGHYVKGYENKKNCWCSYYAENPNEEQDFKCQICHSFITDGMIQFLTDCTHELAGQTVALPDFG